MKTQKKSRQTTQQKLLFKQFIPTEQRNTPNFNSLHTHRHTGRFTWLRGSHMCKLHASFAVLGGTFSAKRHPHLNNTHIKCMWASSKHVVFMMVKRTEEYIVEIHILVLLIEFFLTCLVVSLALTS